MDYYSLFVCTAILIFSTSSYFVQSLAPRDIAFLILSQGNKYNLKLATDVRKSILDQAEQSKQDVPPVDLSHVDFPHVGDWIVLPLIPKLVAKHQNSTRWLVVCTENTYFRLDKLVHVLAVYDYTKDVWLGHALYDREATIIHHFAFHDDPHGFLYPNMASGVAISMPLLQRLSSRVTRLDDSAMEFAIDAAHELAMFVWDKGHGTVLRHQEAFCVQPEGPHCASHVVPFVTCDTVPLDAVYFAVKTYRNFHEDRVRVVKSTWGQHTPHIGYFSDVADPDVPTVRLDVPNTEHGHCGKTTAILRHVSAVIRARPHLKWLLVADDDTILSPARLRLLLSCYDSADTVAIGERYGYQVHTAHGYNYLTGGSGMVFSAPLVHALTEAGVCECPADSVPDDMYLGVCLARLGVALVHAGGFHQARPGDYPPEYLASQLVVSFHKHWMEDPVAVYRTWFEQADLEAAARSNRTKQKVEL